MTDAADAALRHYLSASVQVRASLTGGGPPRGYSYISLEDFVLKHGQPWTSAPRPKGVRQGKPKQCFDNAYHLVDSARGTRLGLRYVEGYAYGFIPVLHAWAVTPEGTVIDPTWPDNPDVDRAYFGVAFPLNIVGAAAALHEYYGVLDDFRNQWPMLHLPYEPAATLKHLKELYRARLATDESLAI